MPKAAAIDLSQVELGELDSAFDRNFLEYAIELPILNQIRAETKYIIVGPKGSGKTAIRLQLTASTPEIRKITVSQSDSFEVKDLNTDTSGEIKKKIEAFIIGLIVRQVNSYEDYDVSRLVEFEKTPLLGFFQRVARGISIKPPFVSIALGEIFPEDKKDALSYLISEPFLSILRSIIGKNKLEIFIDDIDTFVSSQPGSQRTEVLIQLLYAVTDLNLNMLKGHAWITVFIKSEIFKEIRKNATELDKSRTYIENVAWDAEGLRRMVERRLRWNFDKQRIPNTSFNEVFGGAGPDKSSAFFARVTTMAVNGPRNAIDLLKRCIARASQMGRNKVLESDIDEVAFQYGNEVITALSSFYQKVYPEVDQLIDLLFRGFKSEFTRGELEEQIKSEFLNKAQVKQEFGQGWSTKVTAYRLIEIFYEIGVIGVFSSIQKRFVYSFEDPNAQLGLADKIGVHPGLRKFLETE